MGVTRTITIERNGPNIKLIDGGFGAAAGLRRPSCLMALMAGLQIAGAAERAGVFPAPYRGAARPEGDMQAAWQRVKSAQSRLWSEWMTIGEGLLGICRRGRASHFATNVSASSKIGSNSESASIPVAASHSRKVPSAVTFRIRLKPARC
jgi:hypothetical protein